MLIWVVTVLTALFTEYIVTVSIDRLVLTRKALLAPFYDAETKPRFRKVKKLAWHHTALASRAVGLKLRCISPQSTGSFLCFSPAPSGRLAPWTPARLPVCIIPGDVWGPATPLPLMNLSAVETDVSPNGTGAGLSFMWLVREAKLSSTHKQV